MPDKLEATHQFHFDQKFEERTILSKDGLKLNGVLFKAENSKGLIFYLHGNGGSLESIGGVAKTYTKLNYDVFILDYRGYGKSQGVISNEEDFFNDNQIAYNLLKKEYPEKDIVVLGYSIGSGMAAELASRNHPKMLILEAPYYNLTDLMKRKYSLVPTFILKYKFATNTYLKSCKIPIFIFHGMEDKSTFYTSSLKLKEEFKDKVKLISLEGQGHSGITENEKYQKELREILVQ